MTIEKAIDLLSYKLQFLNYPDLLDFKDALKLGIEALKEVQYAREGNPALDGELLPGETEE